ncbi:flavodoxin family protein [Methanoregula sp.]|uniref:flavodoxin family protein n=1 Tax=Methanoregula sp. TaxID=2052170 RepID=UPI003C74FEAE
MKICTIYHSHSGTTRGVAEKVKAACGGELVEVTLKERHSLPVAYFLGWVRSMKHGRDPIEPEHIDISGFDCVVIGTPVWGRRPTPAITAAVEGLEGCMGKKAVLFATCRNAAGDTIPVLARALEEKGMVVRGQFVFTTHDLEDNEPANVLISKVKETGSEF